MKRLGTLLLILALASGCAKRDEGIAHLRRVADEHGLKWGVYKHGPMYCAGIHGYEGDKHVNEVSCTFWGANRAAELVG